MSTAFDVEKLILCDGIGTPDGEMCIMSAASLLAGEEFGDHPACVAASIQTFLRIINDCCPKGPRQRLKELLPHIMGSADRGSEEERGFSMADWACRVALPLYLRGKKLSELAVTAESIERVTDQATASRARSMCRKITTAVGESAAAANYAADSAFSARYAVDSARYAAAAAAGNITAATDRVSTWNKLLKTIIPLVKKLCA